MAAQIPNHELAAYVNAVMAATKLACDGEPGLGYAGLLRSQEEAGERAARKSWGPQLLAIYQDALAQYARERGLKVE